MPGGSSGLRVVLKEIKILRVARVAREPGGSPGLPVRRKEFKILRVARIASVTAKVRDYP